MKKQFKFILAIPLLLLIAIATWAFRQSPAPANVSASTHVWYVLTAGGDPENPSDYIASPGFDPQNNGCQGTSFVCAIEALPGSDPDFPDISGDPETDPNVLSVLKRNTP